MFEVWPSAFQRRIDDLFVEVRPDISVVVYPASHDHIKDSIQRYLGALGYALDLRAVDLDSVKTTVRPKRPMKTRIYSHPRRKKTVVRRRAAD